jgi:multidrug resistance efflux pump
MIAFLCIVYTAVVVLLFKLKLLKPRPFPIAWVIVAGVLLIGGVFVFWMQCAPMSAKVVTTQYVVQLVPYVKGQIKKIHAQPLEPLKKGELLLEINPEPYQYKVNQLQAQLQVAQENVKLAKASLDAARANVAKARAGVTQAEAAVTQAVAAVKSAKAALAKAQAADVVARTDEKIALDLQKIDAGAISKLRVAQAEGKRQEADAALTQADAGLGEAQAAEQQAQAALSAARFAELQAEAAEKQAYFSVGVATDQVPAVQAQLDDALFDLGQCRMTAAEDGYVVNWQVQEGTMLVPLPLVAAGTFIATAHTYIVASFPQNYLPNVEAGNDVEVVLDPYPGRLFTGKVEAVIPATGEGQYAPSGAIPSAAAVGSKGFLAVKIRLDDAKAAHDLPLGAGGTVAVYTDHGKAVHIVSKVAIRMKKWLLFVAPA